MDIYQELPIESRAGVQISGKAFLQSALILLAFMTLAGVLTRVAPAGSIERFSAGGREFQKYPICFQGE